MPFLELTAAHPATPKKGRGLLRPAVVVEERNAPTAAGSGLGRKPGQPFLSSLGPLFPPFPKQLFVRSRRASGQSAWPGVQSPRCPGCTPWAADRRQRCRSRPRAALHVRVRQRLQILPPEKGVSWSGQKVKKETTQLERTTKMQRRSLLRCQRVGGSG